MSTRRRRPEDDALALFGVLVVLFTIVSLLAGCLRRDPTWPGWPTPADSTRCRSEQCA